MWFSRPRPNSAAALLVALFIVGAPSAATAAPSLAVDLRHMCDTVAAGLHSLSELGRPALVRVSPLTGDADRATRDLRRVLGDYLGDCLHRTHDFEVERGPGPGAVDIVIVGAVTRGPQTYTVSIQSIAGAERTLSSLLHPLPIEAADEYVGFILAPRTPAAAMLRSAALPGWGQIYNGQTSKGVIFASAEALLLGSAAAFYLARQDAQTAYDYGFPETVPRASDRDLYEGWAKVALGLAAAVWVGAIIDAWLDGYRYDPDRAFDRRGRIGPPNSVGVGVIPAPTGLRWRWSGTGLVGEW